MELEKNKAKDCRIYFNLGICYEKLNDVSNAVSYYDKSLRLNCTFSPAVINYSNLLTRIGKIN